MIAESHLAMLGESGITADFAMARGYETITDPERLVDLVDGQGITKAGRHVPGLLIPLRRAEGSTWGYQYRPDVPRCDSNGRPRKYETPYGQRNGLDIPPGVAAMLADPSVPLFITEGTKKADAGALNGLCIVDLIGVWNWLHTNTAGGKMAMPEWRDCALNGRRVIIAFDSDMTRNDKVQKAARGLAGYLATKGARIEYLWLPGDDEKTGLDDYLAEHSVEELWQLVKPVQPPPVSTSFLIPSKTSATAQPRRSTEVPAIARLPRILDAVAEEVQCGLVGEERLAQTLYLVLTSRLLDKQVSAGVKGHSASGKSYTVETVTRLFPPEAYLEFTAMSEKALIYSDDDYAHRTLVVYEITALREGVEDDMTSYFVRSLLSEGRIDYQVTVKGKDGGFTTKKIVKQGPTNLIFTTTKTHVHAENETRILSLATDDSREQTKRVLRELADESNGARDPEPWRDLQRWLADQENRVTIPYGRQLAELISPVAVRLRRDFGSLLALIRAHAVLHQASRSRDDAGRIIATLDDYDVVRDLVADTIAEGVGTIVSGTVRETVNAVKELASAHPWGVMARDIAAYLNLDKSNVSRRLAMAADDGYLVNQEDKRGRPGRWVIGDPLPGSDGLLPTAAQLRNPVAVPDLGSCAVAPESDSKKDTNGQPRCACGEPLTQPVSIERGTCEDCHLFGPVERQADR
ncbi:Mycobacterium numidiamassiliense ORFan [Mycobacterium numidiamassiliense]|uniref:Mycobacterium numidiamassiliense ORFan n=1 Tax=Mycobacterium numidiamassiliense TaxID=1841861 RepID=A0A2U3PHX1_9MYCO|nr:DUF3854 domain-containing protein [Mycobacterium numidiamassiliense]SPM43341.1 Mycobacterium numidiamassiliense ORFan [Mycobacterium numidiamassiliense]